MKRHCRDSGFSLIEMLIAISIAGVLMGMLYPAFSAVTDHVTELNVKQEMTQKGQRVLDYITEEFRMAGLYVGARPSITFCGQQQVNALMHTEGAADNGTVNGTPNVRYDIIRILTSERITTDVAGASYLITQVNANKGDTILTVNAPNAAKVNSLKLGTGTNNARAFITLDTLKPTLGAMVYEVTAYNSSNLTLKWYNYDANTNTTTVENVLDQNVNANSNVYSVVRKQFGVDTSRNLRVTTWDKDCSQNPDTLLSSSGDGNNGGVDGFHVEYTLWNNLTSALENTNVLTADRIGDVRSITIWLLLRADFPASGYVNTTTYSLGQNNPQNIGPFNDNYRRLLLSRTVEVKNAVL